MDELKVVSPDEYQAIEKIVEVNGLRATINAVALAAKSLSDQDKPIYNEFGELMDKMDVAIVTENLLRDLY